MRSAAVAAAVAAAALVAAWALDLQLADRHLSRPYDVVHVPDSTATRIASLGHKHFVSTLYWLAAVQYIGEPKADERGWEKLYPLIDLVTDLDPRHGYAYQTAGIVLSASNRLEESTRILEKGMEKGPPWWTFPYYVSFNYWFYLGDYARGAEYARIAARRPGASPNISHLALSLSSKSGDPEDAIAMLQELRATVKDEVSAGRLDEQLKLAHLEKGAQAVERAAFRFHADRGAWPARVEDLVPGYLPALPEDPFGGKWYRDPDGRVRSTANGFRFSIVEGPHRPSFEYKTPESDLRSMPQ
jgi:tetratricopeptide (TPR) repeat protein